MSISNVAITPEIVAEHGLSEDEYASILKILGREPNMTELGVFSAMYSEHCSYKSSKKWLKTLPTEAPHVIQGPGENAGVIDIGDGEAAVFKIESHNHPSFIEPYQGAATGVGGILRDVFTMGARPIANLNALRFGSPEHAKTRHLVGGVVAGIAGYGNCMGIPTVAGEVNFHPAYNGNILVNAMTVGLAPADRIFYSAAAGAGNPVIYVGAKTGRDGIHGATMSSAEFNEDSEEKRPTVQVGDPFTEKLLLEACLELMATDTIIAIQDMGAAGLTSSAVEMAGKGGLGIEMDLAKVPAREEKMTPYELMLSESQERMLIILKPGPEAEAEARAIFDKWELDFAVIGHLTTTGNLVLKMGEETVGDIPIAPMVAESPEYDRPWQPTPAAPVLDPASVPAPASLTGALKDLIGSPDLCSRRWVWEQYDHLIMGDTAIRPGGDAAMVRVRDSKKGLAVCVDCTPRYVKAAPETGGAQAVAETWRNITATGAKPLAVTNNMNFGNPTKPEIMGQFVGAINGMKAACLALDYPVVSGNVSLYNETEGKAILPTPVIGGVGVIADIAKRATVAFKEADEAIVVIGETTGWLGQSIYLREVEGREEGAPPPVDLALEKKNGDFVRGLIEAGSVTACHDISDGGLAVALAEMALGAKGLGAEVVPQDGLAAHAWAFGEDQARYVVTAKDADAVLRAAEKAGVSASAIGRTTGDGELKLSAGDSISVSMLRSVFEERLPDYMAAS
ncbi:phosphoribosylformylglycinamidine synthase subunit PurL [Nisaea acidiphila]|uniref:Phosphoribosylformylglycinamidine synthase subunit PurL n=1 Tax=Nisaea acidiphila TaxID=1862145 RepID=A0A9J7AW84_9PROT|nr:phosphoribosylformylglycinamidine synthase subunit PurL [Nisaea acidiphila]UUX49693.1 phosphoribosylformylglycinamidine synthase subunit PurL [Nisaea acidiphila]